MQGGCTTVVAPHPAGWRKLNGSEKLQELIDGIVFVDGEREAA
jgi:hypothetical protein